MNRTALSTAPMLLGGLGLGVLIAWAVVVGHDYLAIDFVVSQIFWGGLGVGLLVAIGGMSLVLWTKSREGRVEVPVKDRLPFAVAVILLSSQFSGMRPPLSPSVFCLVFLVMYWFVYRLLRQGEPVQTSMMTWIFMILGGLVVLSVFDREKLFFQAWRTLPKFIGPVLIIDLLNSKQRVKKAVEFFLAVLMVMAIIGIGQVLISVYFGRELTLASSENAHRGHLFRATGFALSGNTLGEHLLVSIMVSLYWFLSKDDNRPKRFLMFVFLLTCTAAILTYSRSVWLAGIVGLLVLPAVLIPKRAPLWGMTLVGFMALGLTGGAVQEVVASGLEFGGQESTETFDDRYFMAKGGVEFVLVDPYRGVGISNFASTAQVSSNNWSVHNAPLQVASEIGVLGAVLIGLMLVWLGIRLLYARMVVQDTELQALLGGLFVALVSLVVVAQGSPAGFSQFYFLFFGLTEAVVIVSLRQNGEPAY